MKTKRYWLRGGVVGFSLSILVFIFSYLRLHFLDSVLYILSIPTELFVKYFSSCDGLECYAVAIVTMPLLNIALGVILGWIYGKIKNIKTNLPL